MKKLLILLSGAAVLMVPVGAFAGYPNTDNTRILPKSIGGLALGDSKREARRAWGKPDRCQLFTQTTICEFGARESRKGYARYDLRGNKVNSMILTAGRRNGQFDGPPSFRGPLLRFKTRNGVGLGSLLSKVKKEFPRARRETFPGIIQYYICGGPKNVLFFNAETDQQRKRITTLGVDIVGGEGDTGSANPCKRGR
jgi:hypothetical protein